jgi:hypothetical protein
MRNLLTTFCLLSSLILCVDKSLHAAVPGNVIKGWQDSAPEFVDVTVLSADKNSSVRPYAAVAGGSVTITNMILHAKIDVVHRSASKLTPGTEIVVKYLVQHYDPVAPPDGNYGIVLGPQDRATAYLKKSGENVFDLSCIVGCLIKL